MDLRIAAFDRELNLGSNFDFQVSSPHRFGATSSQSWTKTLETGHFSSLVQVQILTDPLVQVALSPKQCLLITWLEANSLSFPLVVWIF